MDIAVTRDIPRSLARCELTHLAREPIDYARAVSQHEAYCRTLGELGLSVVRLPADEAYPDCPFVEDTAVVLDEVAVLASPGVASRRGEVTAMARTLARYRPLLRVEPPATLEGGDVLVMGRTILVGRSARTNVGGIAALARAVGYFGYQVRPIEVTACLHLKSAVTALDDQTVLLNPAWVDRGALAPFQIIEVDEAEPGAANVLRVREAVLAHPGYRKTLERLVDAGYSVIPVEISEVLKAEAALTCKSLLLRG